MIYANRVEAGRRLASFLKHYANRKDVIVLGVPRGGVPVAFEVARALNAPLDVFVLRKLGVPQREEFAFGAVASGGVRVLDPRTIEALGISDLEIEMVTSAERTELERRERAYRGGRSPLKVNGMTVILVDDGIATGSSVQAAVQALRRMNPARIVIATPVAPASTCRRLQLDADELICPEIPQIFYGVGQFYDDFSQVPDEEVVQLLDRAAQQARVDTEEDMGMVTKGARR